MKNKSEIYAEMPFKVFLKHFPEVKNLFPPEILKEFKSNSSYIVRYDGKQFEIGFKSDDWVIN